MGMFFPRRRSFITETDRGAALRAAVDACRFEPLESRELLSLTVDLRLAEGGKTVNVTSVDQVINMEVWAVVRGSNGTGADDGLQMVVGSFLSTDSGGGAARGDLSATLLSPFNGNGSQAGSSVDLDGDGDEDVGSNNQTSTAGFFGARSGSLTLDGSVSGDSNEFKVGTLKFRVSELLDGTETRINFVPREIAPARPVATWWEDGAGVTAQTAGHIGVGAPIILKNPGVAINATLVDGTLTVNGTASNNNIKLTISGEDLVATVDGQTKRFLASSVSKIRINGLDGNDVITIGKGVGAGRLDGGDGNDTLVGGAGNDTLNGGKGNDLLKGNAGKDALDGGTGADVVRGGDGNDTATYASRRNAVRVSLNDKADDGETNEGDDVRSDVETIFGGGGNDVLRGNAMVNVLKGNAGADTLFGGAGNDVLDGGAGIDKLSGEDGDDKLLARDLGVDSMYGGLGTDRAQVDPGDIRKDIEKLLA